MGMYFITHLYLELVMFFFLSFVLIGHLWAQKARDPEKEYNCPVLVFFRAAFFIVSTVFGLIIWDMVIKELVFGVLGYGNLMHYLGIVLVLAVVGTALIWGSVFVAPTRKGLITFAAVLVTFIYLYEVYSPGLTVELKEESAAYMLIMPIVVGFIVQASTSIAHGIYLKVNREGKKDKRLWDNRKTFKKIFSLKTTVALWGLIFIDLVLSFEGHGLVSWMSFETFLLVVAIVGGWAIVLKIWNAILKRKKFLKDEWDQKHFSRTDKLIRHEEKVVMDDGEELQGFIYQSAVSPGQKASVEKAPGPAVLFLHGFGGYAQDFHFEPILSALALGGYTVFAYDYRWSGHSRKEGQKGIFQGIMKHGAPLFNRIYDDVNNAIDWVLSHEDLVDPERLAIVGFSFGGSIALSKNVMEDPRVKVILAGCAVHDFASNMKKLVLEGPFYIKIMGKLIGMSIKRNTGLGLNQFLDALSEFTPATSYEKITAEIPSNNGRVFLAHCKDDEVVNYEMNFVKNKAMLELDDENCLVFETGGHEFLNNGNALGAWMIYQLHNNL